MNKINKNTILFVCLLLLCTTLKAGDISKEKALKVAKHFFSLEFKTNPEKFTLNYQAIAMGDNSQKCAMHIFSGEKSFIIIAGDDRVFPIIGYSKESSFPAKGEVENLDWWIDNSAKAITAETRLKSTVDQKTKDAWTFYLSDAKSGSVISKVKNVLPFLNTTWNQDAGYNYYCPVHQMGPDGKCYAGCVATAMAQVMKYYNYPKQGKGSHSYLHANYGNLAVDFSQRIYDWQHMGAIITMYDTVKRNAIARLIYDCGISVDMYYAPSASSSYLYKTQTALYDYFKYKRYIAYAERSNFDDDVWQNMMIENLDMKYPILYGGQDASAGGHAFVCDGYESDTNNQFLFHFNWGWSGFGNGYFNLDIMNSGNGNFKYSQDMVYNIVPDSAIYPLCIPNKKYTSQSYSFHDGSFGDNYQNNTNCQWLIKPDSGSFIKLDFVNFRTEQGADILTVYDGETTSSPVLGTYSGNYTVGNLPSPVVSTSGAMLLVFVTNSSVTDLGWVAKYSTIYVGIDENDIAKQLQVFPNPAHNQLNISGNFKQKGNVKISVYNTIGMEVLSSTQFVNEGFQTESIDISSLKSGIYILNTENNKGKYFTKFIVE